MQKNGLFHTPDSWDDLEKWIMRHNTDSRVSLFTAAHMARNITIDQLSTKESTNG